MKIGRFLSHLKHLQSCFLRYIKRLASASRFISDKALLRVLIVLEKLRDFKITRIRNSKTVVSAGDLLQTRVWSTT